MLFLDAGATRITDTSEIKDFANELHNVLSVGQNVLTKLIYLASKCSVLTKKIDGFKG